MKKLILIALSCFILCNARMPGPHVREWDGTESFSKFIKKSEQPIVVKCHAKWCAPCHRFAPIVQEVAEGKAGELITFISLDIDKFSDIAIKYKVERIPTVLYFFHGKLIDRTGGITSSENFKNKLRKVFRFQPTDF